MKRPGSDLDPELAALLTPQRIQRKVPPEMRARVLFRARATLVGDVIPPASHLPTAPVSIAGGHRLFRIAAAASIAIAGAAVAPSPGSTVERRARPKLRRRRARRPPEPRPRASTRRRAPRSRRSRSARRRRDRRIPRAPARKATRSPRNWSCCSVRTARTRTAISRSRSPSSASMRDASRTGTWPSSAKRCACGRSRARDARTKRAVPERRSRPDFRAAFCCRGSKLDKVDKLDRRDWNRRSGDRRRRPLVTGAVRR